MASYNNFQEVWFTIQALRLYQDLRDTEILVVDNYGDETLQQFCMQNSHSDVRYCRFTELKGTAAPRDRVFAEAQGEWVLCIDSHVMLAPGIVERFRMWCEGHSDCTDLIQGPIVFDDLRTVSDAWDDIWDCEMWGLWRVSNVPPGGDHYEISMMGLGLFACRKDAWLGFNPQFRGFGGEEGYIHQKFRNAGRKTISLPWLRWVHWFSRHGTTQKPVPYPLLREDKIRNYEIGFAEVGIDPGPMRRHFGITPKIKHVQVDTNAVCGSRCWFCPVRYIQRPAGQVMPQELFERILDGINEAVQLGSVVSDWSIWLSSYNDLLLDPLLSQRLEALRRRGLRFALLTNGVGLQHHAALVHEYRDVIHCTSVNLPAGNPESYRQHTCGTGETFETIIKGLLTLHALDPEYYQRTLTVTVNGAHDNQPGLVYEMAPGDTDRQIEQLQALLPYQVLAARPLADRAGHLRHYALTNGIERPVVTGCNNCGNRLSEWLHINSFGKLYLCCQDYLEETVYGDLSVTHMVEALVSDRSVVLERVSELCKKCSFSTASKS